MRYGLKGNMDATCHCGAIYRALTEREIAALNKLRGHDILVCPCGHEIDSPKTAHDIRKLGSIKGQLAHQGCAIGGAKVCSIWVSNYDGSPLSHPCMRKPTMLNGAGLAVCTFHRDRPEGRR